jgi:2-polyprenyl-6-methoxyphenol hydroxylase-like FAD-dependent oxidoreductase
MAGAYVLAHELHAAQGDPAAFRSYEQRFRPFVTGKQLAAQNIGRWFAPRTRLGVAWRNAVSVLLSSAFVMRRTLGKQLLDEFDLPAFERHARVGSRE